MVFARVPLSGPKGRATMIFNATTSDGPWVFSVLTVTVEGTHEVIDLRGAANSAPQ